jgi:uncharacterized damage-inducible protein DinB
MIFNSLSEVFDHMDGVRDQFTARVRELDETRHGARPDEKTWCVAELVEHLSITEKSITGVVERLLVKSEEIGAPPAAGGLLAVPAKFPSAVRRIDGHKAEAPARIKPQGGVPVGDSLASLEASREHIRSLRSRMEAVDLSEAKFPHPMLGDLTLPQWLVFISEHEARHAAQMENILQRGETVSTET